MNHIILLRHAHSQANEKNILAGRMSGVGLSDKGKGQALSLVARIGAASIDHLHISPMQRCQETIQPWMLSKHSSTLKTSSIDDAFDEVDYGNWSGLPLKKLRKDPLWSVIQNKPSQVKFPGGESIKAAQKRAVSQVDELIGARSKKNHLIVTHSDLIKLMVTHFIGNKLDNFQHIAIDPATFTVLRYDTHHLDLLTTNSSDSLERILGK